MKNLKMLNLPVVWIPQEEVANSPGNPEWDGTKGKFGPFDDQFFIGDQTLKYLPRITSGSWWTLPGLCDRLYVGFQCGNIRLKFDQEGSLWVGQTSRGWVSRGAKPFGMQKVVWDGKTVPFEIQDVKLQKKVLSYLYQGSRCLC